MLSSDFLLAQAREGGIGAGTLSFLILVLMGVATALLIRNMNGRLKRLPSTFDPAPDVDGSDRGTAPPVEGNAEVHPGAKPSG